MLNRGDVYQRGDIVSTNFGNHNMIDKNGRSMNHVNRKLGFILKPLLMHERGRSYEVLIGIEKMAINECFLENALKGKQ